MGLPFAENVLIGGQLVAPQFKAKWIRGSTTSRQNPIRGSPFLKGVLKKLTHINRKYHTEYNFYSINHNIILKEREMIGLPLHSLRGL